MGVDLLLDMGGLGVYLFYLQIDLAEVFCQLVLSPFNIGVNLFNFGGDIGICIFQLQQLMLAHFPRHVIPIDLASNTKRLIADTAVQLQFLIMNGTKSKFLGLLRNINPLMFRAQLRGMVLQIAIGTEMGLFGQAVQLGLVRRHFHAVIA